MKTFPNTAGRKTIQNQVLMVHPDEKCQAGMHYSTKLQRTTKVMADIPKHIRGPFEKKVDPKDPGDWIIPVIPDTWI